MATSFTCEELELKGAYLITPFCAFDNRGAFIKDYSEIFLKSKGIEHQLKEVFYTISKKGVVRAIHFQIVKEQAKLVRCITGKIYDVIVDLRPSSPTFKKWIGFYLSGENLKSLLIPAGFGHGYLVLEDSIVSYKCAEKFYSEFDSGIKWDDKDLDIKWPLNEINVPVIISEKDANLPSFHDFFRLM